MIAIQDTRAEPERPDYSEAVANFIAGMTYWEIREKCADFRSLHIRPAAKFSEWLRDQVEESIYQDVCNRISEDP